MKCLVCSAETTERAHEEVIAHACPEGHGMWFDPAALMDAVRTDPNAAGRANTYAEEDSLYQLSVRDVITDDETRVCPECNSPMNSGRYGADDSTNVILDMCPKHGVWLDAGELEQLEAWAASHFAPESASTHDWEQRLAARQSGDDGEVIEQRLSFGDALRSLLRR